MTADSLICPVENFNVAEDKPQQNDKSVECRLRKTVVKLAETEANVYIFKTMKSMGIATNDVSNFVKKQTIHKRVNQAPDT